MIEVVTAEEVINDKCEVVDGFFNKDPLSNQVSTTRDDITDVQIGNTENIGTMNDYEQYLINKDTSNEIPLSQTPEDKFFS